MAACLTNYGAKQFLDYSLGSLALTRPTTFYVGLASSDPTNAGTNNEISGVGYARQAATWTTGALGQRSTANTNIITFGPATGAGFTPVYAVLWDAVSGGNAWFYGPITSSPVVAGDSYTIPIGFLSATFPALVNP